MKMKELAKEYSPPKPLTPSQAWEQFGEEPRTNWLNVHNVVFRFQRTKDQTEQHWPKATSLGVKKQQLPRTLSFCQVTHDLGMGCWGIVVFQWGSKPEPFAWLRINTQVWSYGLDLWMHYSISICTYYLKLHICAPCAHEYIVHPQYTCMHTTCIFTMDCKLTPQVELKGSPQLSLSWMHVLNNQQRLLLGAFYVEWGHFTWKWRLSCRTFDKCKQLPSTEMYSQGNSLVVKQEVIFFICLELKRFIS